jgi:hypothetical protein
MMKKILFALSLLWYACSPQWTPCELCIQQSALVDSTFPYLERLKLVDKEVGELVAFYPLETNAQFCFLYKNAGALDMDTVLSVMDPQKYTLQQRLIANCVMQHLSEKQYLDYFFKVTHLFKQGKTEERMFEEALYACFCPNPAILRNYKEKEIVHVLKTIQELVSIQNQSRIEEVLSGKAWHDIQHPD